MLKYKNVSISFNNKVILDDISLDIIDNSITTIMGKNGSGKTTLVSLLFNDYKYDGNIYIDNLDAKKLKEKELAKYITILRQKKNTVDIIVYDYLKLGRFPYLGISKRLNKKDYLIVDEMIDYVGIRHLINRNLFTLSGGEKQLVYLALMLIQDTKYVILDEPINFLDIFNINIFKEIVYKLKNKNKTIILILHDINLAVELSDYIILLDNHKIIFNQDKKNINKEDLIGKYFKLEKHIIDNKIIYL